MRVAAVTICILSALAIVCNGGEFFGSRFSVVTLPFKYHKIVPDFIDEGPRELLQVTWPGAEARLGNVLPISRVNTKPKFSWDCDRNAYYTLVVFDCDPLGHGKPGLSELRYWAIGNIHKCDFDAADVITDYLRPIPIYNSDSHRLVYLLFKRSSRIKFEEPFITSTAVIGRFYTSVRKFAIQYDLGAPVAGNFISLMHDSAYTANYALLDKPFPLYAQRSIAAANLGPEPTS